ncbi:hypothetical protein ACS0TY_036286 [Phlomoides rotata]
MEGGNNNQDGSRAGAASKTDKTRRIWTTREEQVLMAALKDLVAHGWKSDNGFHTGYLVSCENAMKVAFPNTGLLATPHIASKITSWKKSYGNIVTAQYSGVGFNTITGQAIGSGGEDVSEAFIFIDDNDITNPTADQGLEE